MALSPKLYPLQLPFPDGRASEARSDVSSHSQPSNGSLFQGSNTGALKAKGGPPIRSVWPTQMFLLFKKYLPTLKKMGHRT